MSGRVPSYQMALDNAVEEMEAEVKRLQGFIAGLRNGTWGGRTSIAVNTPPRARVVSKKPAKAKRSRRSSEEVAKQANQMADFIKSKGKEGATGKEITAKFGPVLPSIKAFINAKAVTNVKTKGAASKTVYFV